MNEIETDRLLTTLEVVDPRLTILFDWTENDKYGVLVTGGRYD